MTSLTNERMKESGIYCKLVLKHGGIPFVKSNVPMILKTTETINWIYGRTLNPWDTSRTPGGSSGGESALISSLCSPAGIGGDIGGSIRCPASYTAIYGFKPTATRVTNTGCLYLTESKTWSGLKIINGACGPMARNVDDLVTLFKVMLDPDCQQSDMLAYWSPWNDKLFTVKRRCRIGYIQSCKEFEACKASVRAVRLAVDIGIELGHDMIDMNHVDISSSFYTGVSGISAGNFIKAFICCLRGEMHIPEYNTILLKERVPYFVAKLFLWWANKNPSRFLKVMKYTTNTTVKDLIFISRNVDSYKRHFEKITLDHKIDAWILPVNCLPATKHTHAAKMVFGVAYTLLFNMLDYPVGTIPMTYVRDDEQSYESAIDDQATKLCKETMKGSAGLPIGIQLACPTGRDELTLNLMKQFQSKLTKVDYPFEINFKG
jgi:fatty acid amide hydrolase